MDLDPNLNESVERLRAFLRAQPQEELVRRLLDLTNIDAGLQRELWHWYLSAQIKDNPQALAGLITDMMTPASTQMDPREVPHYLRRASEALPLLNELVKRDASAAARVLERALVVAWAVICESTDDEQEAPDFARSLTQLYLQALKETCPQPADFAPRLVELLRTDALGAIDIGQILATVDDAAVRSVGSYLDTVTANFDQRDPQLQADVPGSGKPGSSRRQASMQSELLAQQRRQDQVRRIREAFISATEFRQQRSD